MMTPRRRQTGITTGRIGSAWSATAAPACSSTLIKIAVRVIFWVLSAVMAAVAASRVSRAINTAFIERHNATDRHHNARKRRQTYCFSKSWAVHKAMTYFTMYSYNFCWPMRTLREKVTGRWRPRTPVMAAGLADHVWSMREWLAFPIVQRS